MIFDPYLPLGMYEGGNGKNRETFPHIPDEPSKSCHPRNFCRLRQYMSAIDQLDKATSRSVTGL